MDAVVTMVLSIFTVFSHTFPFIALPLESKLDFPRPETKTTTYRNVFAIDFVD